MSLFLHVLQSEDLDQILELERQQLKERMSDEMEREILSWNARWRKESLEHYLPLGWSFCAKEDDKIVGYFLAQALLFFDGQTQTLWVEHVQFLHLKARDALVELAVKLGREKHLQKVYFPNDSNLSSALTTYKAEPWMANVMMVRTTKS